MFNVHWVTFRAYVRFSLCVYSISLLVGELNVHKIHNHNHLCDRRKRWEESSNNHVMAIIISFISLLLSKQYLCNFNSKNFASSLVFFLLFPIELQLWKLTIKMPSCDVSTKRTIICCYYRRRFFGALTICWNMKIVAIFLITSFSIECFLIQYKSHEQASIFRCAFSSFQFLKICFQCKAHSMCSQHSLFLFLFFSFFTRLLNRWEFIVHALEYGLWMYYGDLPIRKHIHTTPFIRSVSSKAIHISSIVAIVSCFVWKIERRERGKNRAMKYMFNIYFYYINGFSYRISSLLTMTTCILHTTIAYRMLNAPMAVAMAMPADQKEDTHRRTKCKH